jgi:hypothetical protein
LGFAVQLPQGDFQHHVAVEAHFGAHSATATRLSTIYLMRAGPRSTGSIRGQTGPCSCSNRASVVNRRAVSLHVRCCCCCY